MLAFQLGSLGRGAADFWTLRPMQQTGGDEDGAPPRSQREPASLSSGLSLSGRDARAPSARPVRGSTAWANALRRRGGSTLDAGGRAPSGEPETTLRDRAH
jgi:hypothetical protein